MPVHIDQFRVGEAYFTLLMYWSEAEQTVGACWYLLELHQYVPGNGALGPKWAFRNPLTGRRVWFKREELEPMSFFSTATDAQREVGERLGDIERKAAKYQKDGGINDATGRKRGHPPNTGGHEKRR